MLCLLKQPWFTSITSLVIFWPLLCGITPLECALWHAGACSVVVLNSHPRPIRVQFISVCLGSTLRSVMRNGTVGLLWHCSCEQSSGGWCQVYLFWHCFCCSATAYWLCKMCQTNLSTRVQLANNWVGLVYLKWIFFYGWFLSRGLRNGLQQWRRLSRCFVLHNRLFYSLVLWSNSRSKRSRPWRWQDSGKEERLDVGIWTERKGEMIINSAVQSKQDCRAKHNRDGPFYLKQMAVQQALRHPNFSLLTVARLATAKMSERALCSWKTQWPWMPWFVGMSLNGIGCNQGCRFKP